MQAVLTVDLGAVADNWLLLRDRAAPGAVAGVVKADGYGLGAAPVARALHAVGCRHFFVAHLTEGVAVRAALARLADGSYGECTDCGQPVGVARLLAQPAAARCIACQSKAEARGER